jgi:translocation and assembly module TamB
MILTKEKSPPFGQLNLHIDIPQNMFIRGYGINSQWHGKLNLTGPINSPQIGGSITLQRGQIDIIGKTLQLTKGQIKFIPEEGPIDPILKIVATKSVNDVKAMIKVEGRSSRPEINFASHPILPQEEVVSLILFGKSLNSVTAAQSLKLATAIASIKSSSRDQSITEQFRTAFGLDEIGIQGEDSSDDNNRELTSGYSFHVGKQLTDRAYIAVKQGLTGEASTDVILRYDLTEQAKAELETGTGRDAGAAGLSWEKRY